MEITHRLTAIGICPVNGQRDQHTVFVHTDRTIFVEEIIAAVADLTTKPISQEDFTRLLARRLEAEVVTECVHSGVWTEVKANGSPLSRSPAHSE